MRKIILLSAIAAAAVGVPTVAQAQRAPAAVIVVVDTDRVANECTACRAASAQLASRQNALRTRAQTLQQQLQTAGQPIQTAVNALSGRQPDAALQQRITAYQRQEQQAQQELTNSQRTFQSTQTHVNQQIGQRLGPVISQVAAARGANMAVDRNATLYAAATVDVTTDVIARLNAVLPSVSVTPLPQAQQQQQPQGR
jgi:Skp family chaperone for outer membrane proteins